MSDLAVPSKFTSGRARLGLILLLGPALFMNGGIAAAAPVTAEQAIENYRARFESTRELDCPTPSHPDEIIVCGRTGEKDPNRVPLPVEPVPGRRIPGEPATGAAFNCLQSCPQPLRLDLIKAAKVGRKIIRHLLDPD